MAVKPKDDDQQKVEDLFASQPDLIYTVLLRLVAADKELIESGADPLLVCRNADAMRDIAARSEKYGRLTLKQSSFMHSVIVGRYAPHALILIKDIGVVDADDADDVIEEKPAPAPPAPTNPLWGMF